MRVHVNGEDREMPEGATVGDLIRTIGADDGPVAVERNQMIVPRAEHASTVLQDGDELEVVHFVGGG